MLRGVLQFNADLRSYLSNRFFLFAQYFQYTKPFGVGKYAQHLGLHLEDRSIYFHFYAFINKNFYVQSSCRSTILANYRKYSKTDEAGQREGRYEYTISCLC